MIIYSENLVMRTMIIPDLFILLYESDVLLYESDDLED